MVRSLLTACVVLHVAGLATTAWQACAQTPTQPAANQPAGPIEDRGVKSVPPAKSLATLGARAEMRCGEEAVLRVLDERTSMNFADTQLTDALAFLRDKHKIEIVLDRKAIDDAGMKTDELPVTFRTDSLPLRSALALMLRDSQLTWTIHQGVLLITTPEMAEACMVVRVYNVADLVACRDKDNAPWDDYETLIETAVETIQPTTWSSAGGPGSIKPGGFGSARSLVVSQTYEVHEQVVALLKDLRAAGKESGKNEPPRRDPPKQPK